MSADAGGGVPLLPQDTRLVHLATCASTNSEALERAARGEDLPLWVLADRQTAGRGRDGRSWKSEAGNLMASLSVPLDAPASVAGQLSLVAGVAAIAAIGNAGGEINGLRLKWPNDILIGTAKVGGILVENAPIRGGRVGVIGFGVNLAHSVQAEGRETTSLESHGNSRKPLEMLAFLAEAMHEWLSRWRSGTGFADVRAAWLQRAGPVGEPIAVNAGSTRRVGRFAGLDGDGALLIDDGSGSVRRITFGDVTLMRRD